MGGLPEEFRHISIQFSQVVVLTAERRHLMPETA